MHSSAVILNKLLEKRLYKSKKKLGNTNLVASRHIKSEKGSLPVDVHRSKTSPLSDTRTAIEFSGVASNENY